MLWRVCSCARTRDRFSRYRHPPQSMVCLNYSKYLQVFRPRTLEMMGLMACFVATRLQRLGGMKTHPSKIAKRHAATLLKSGGQHMACGAQATRALPSQQVGQMACFVATRLQSLSGMMIHPSKIAERHLATLIYIYIVSRFLASELR